MKRLIKHAAVWNGKGFLQADVLIGSGKILSVSREIPASQAEAVVDAAGLYLAPGFVDVHVHLREPGFTAKETIATGTAAAARGGYTLVCSMPNVDPVPDCRQGLEVQLQAIRRTARVKVVPYGAITRGRKGAGMLADLESMAADVAGFSDDGCGVQTDDLMEAAMREAARLGKPIVAHCEVESLLYGGYIHEGAYARLHGHKGICSESEWRQVERDIELVRRTGCRYHVCHVSTGESVELIRRAQAEGLPVSGETAPHYLVLTEDDLKEEGRFKMNPPLRTASDREALRRAVADGTLAVIATDHAPHTAAEKSRGLAGSAMGIVGLETAFAVLNTSLVQPGLMPLETLIERLSVGPRRIFGFPGGEIVPGAPADLVLLDPHEKYTVDSASFASMGRSTPFEGMQVQGRVRMTLVDGELVYKAE